MIGTYNEPLSSGGKLIVSVNKWEINYFFPGPDLRCRGTSVSVPDKRIEEYINAWKKNFEEYQQLKPTVPYGGTYEKPGLFGMTIRVGGWFEGVCLIRTNKQIKKEKELDALINDLIYAKKRAVEIQEKLLRL